MKTKRTKYDQLFLHKSKKAVFKIARPLVTLIAYVGMLILLKHSVSLSTNIDDLESSIQLLAQILALVVGLLLLGTSVFLTSYDDAETLNQIRQDQQDAVGPLYENYFSGGMNRHKLDRVEFVRWVLSYTNVSTLQFFDEKTETQYFVYRPYWDGVWYQVETSPYKDSGFSNTYKNQIQRLHETAIMAFKVIGIIDKFRRSKGVLISGKPGSGSNGSIWFLEAFNEFKSVMGIDLPACADINSAKRAVQLALSSEHYMREEFQDHSENTKWVPSSLTTFQLHYNEYSESMTLLMVKLEHLRLANANEIVSRLNLDQQEQLFEKLSFKKNQFILDCVRSNASKITIAHSTASYFNKIKRKSVLGIGLSLALLFSLLCFWPYLKFGASDQIRINGFILMYSAGVAALVESMWFFGYLLQKDRS